MHSLSINSVGWVGLVELKKILSQTQTESNL